MTSHFSIVLQLFFTSASEIGEVNVSEYSLVKQLDLWVLFTLSSYSALFVSSVEFNTAKYSRNSSMVTFPVFTCLVSGKYLSHLT